MANDDHPIAWGSASSSERAAIDAITALLLPLKADERMTVLISLLAAQKTMSNDDAKEKNPLAEYQTVTSEEVCAVLRITKRALDRIIAGDASFPRELSLPGVRRWLLSEVRAWMALQQQQRPEWDEVSDA